MISSLGLVKKKMYNYDTFLLFNSPGSKSLGIELLKYIVKEKKRPAVYICIDTPFSSIKKALDREQIDSKAIIFIDAVTLMSGTQVNADNCTYIRSPENLTDISIALSEALNALSASKAYVILDSLSTLLLYNKSATIMKFVHILIAKVKQYNSKGLVISAKKRANDPFTSQVLRFFDCSIEYSGG